MQAQGYSTSLLRAALGLTAGAAAGAWLVALWSLWAEVEAFGLQFVLDHRLQPTLTVFFVALIAWTMGLIVVGAPLWWLLHKLAWRHWPVAIAAGLLLAFLTAFAIATRGFELIPPPSGAPSLPATLADPRSSTTGARGTDGGWRRGGP